MLDTNAVINNLNTNITKLINSPLLKPEQKLNILNQYIWPTLIYPLQCVPLQKIKKGFFTDIDKLIKSAFRK